MRRPPASTRLTARRVPLGWTTLSKRSPSSAKRSSSMRPSWSSPMTSTKQVRSPRRWQPRATPLPVWPTTVWIGGTPCESAKGTGSASTRTMVSTPAPPTTRTSVGSVAVAVVITRLIVPGRDGGDGSGPGDAQQAEAHLVGRALAPHDVALRQPLQVGQPVAPGLVVGAGDPDRVARLDRGRRHGHRCLVVEVPHLDVEQLDPGPSRGPA